MTEEYTDENNQIDIDQFEPIWQTGELYVHGGYKTKQQLQWYVDNFDFIMNKAKEKSTEEPKKIDE